MKAPRAGHTTDSDVAGPFSTPTKGGNRYLSTLVDRDTKKIDGKMVASQGEFFDHYTEFVKMAEAHFGKPNIFSILHSDSATYYKDSARLRQFCAKKGIRQTFSPPYTQALNAIAERCIRTIVEMARTSLNASGLQIVYYGEALMYAMVGHRKSYGREESTATQYTRSSNPLGAQRGYSIYDNPAESSTRSQNYRSASTTTRTRTRTDSYRFRKAEYQKVHTSHSTSTIFPWPRRIRRQDPTTGLLNTQSTHTTTIPHSRNTSDQPETGRHQPKPSGT